MTPRERAESCIQQCTHSAGYPCSACPECIAHALADARAAGFAEAIEKAAKVADDYRKSATASGIPQVVLLGGAAHVIRNNIRALAPATTALQPDTTKGEWRCRCTPDPKFDTSINPACVKRCGTCGAERPASTAEGPK